MALEREIIEAYCRWERDDEYDTLLENEALPDLVLLRHINRTQREISDKCCLILTCWHFAAAANQSFFRFEDHPDLFRFLYDDVKDSIYWLTNGAYKSLYQCGQAKIFEKQAQSSYTGTPTHAALTQRVHKGILVYPAPGSASGDGTFENDPLRVICYRLPLPIEDNDGKLEIDGDLHDLLLEGVSARVARTLKHPMATIWMAEYKESLREKTIPEGVRPDTSEVRIHNAWSSACLGTNLVIRPGSLMPFS